MPNVQTLTDRARRRVGRAVAVLGAIVIGVATLMPSALPSGPARRGDELCLICGELGGVDAVLNTLLFIPLGIGLAIAGVRFSRAMSAMCGATLSIEFLQFALILGRDASIGDVLTNTFGAGAGWLLGTHASRAICPSARGASRLLGAWLVVWIAVQGIGAFALTPNAIQSLYFGQISPDLDDFPRFAGSVIAPSLDGRRIPDGPFDDSRAAYEALARDDGGEVTLGVAPHWQVTRRAAILRVADHERREIFRVGAEGSRLVFASRTGAALLRLRPAVISLGGVFGNDSARSRVDTFQVRARYGSSKVELTIDHRGRQRVTVAQLTTGKAWRVFFPATVYINAAAWRTGLDALWMFTWLIPAGFWAAAAGRGRSGTRGAWPVAAGVAAALGSGLAIGPLFFGLARPTLVEVFAAVAGLAAGASLVYATRRPARSHRILSVG